MVKMSARADGGEYLLAFGLSDRNVELLTAGRPIRIDLADLGIGLEGSMLIFHGKTEADIERTCREAGLIGPATKIVGDLPSGQGRPEGP